MKNRKLLMIPGPIEFEPEVLAAMSQPTTSHVAANFIEIFGRALEQMREVFLSPDGQPFILAGSGTLAMDTVAANLVEPGDGVLVVSTGYFSERFAQILKRYGAEVALLESQVGGRPSLEQIDHALGLGGFKLMTVTHVDTSTGVLTDVKGIAALARRHNVLLAVDGVCSVAGEELRMSEWGVDVSLTASQKAVGVPPGLALVVAGPRAMAAFQNRKSPVMSYYADWANWLPVMQAYEKRQAAYFGTPAVNLVAALQVSLTQILAEGMDHRLARHVRISQACKAGLRALGLGQVPVEPSFAAHTMSAPRYPQGISAADFLAKVMQNGVILAGGLHPAIKAEYFRIGHMGAVTLGDVMSTLSAVERGLAACGYPFEPGISLKAAQAA